MSTKTSGSSPPKFGAETMVWIARTALNNAPQQFKFDFVLWNLRLIRHLVNRQLKRELSVWPLHRLMKSVGLGAQKRPYQALQQDPVLLSTWGTETFRRFMRRSSTRG